jgi:hypothetical protein
MLENDLAYKKCKFTQNSVGLTCTINVYHSNKLVS